MKNLCKILFLFLIFLSSTHENFGQSITWCNLQWPQTIIINQGGSGVAYAQLYVPGVTNATGQGAGIQSWIGYNNADTDPATWTNWVPATFNVDNGNNDEYMATIGAGLPSGTYYYASRFQLNGGSYFYGGFSAGFWDGSTNVSGIMTIGSTNMILWCNLQWPPSDTIPAGDSIQVYARVYAPGITDTTGSGTGIQAWIGYHTANTNPDTWTNWIPAPYFVDAGNDDEYHAYLGASLPAGKYYYASRFKLDTGAYCYGGFQAGSGGFWNGTTNVSGELTIGTISWCNLQWPAADTANAGDYWAYARVYSSGFTEPAGANENLKAWIGYNATNTNPDTWTIWVPASFNLQDGNNDEYKANIGSWLCAGKYYLASRFQLGNGNYFYGGYNTGFWDGTSNVSGQLTINGDTAHISWCNIQWPGEETMMIGDSIEILARVYAPCLTETAGQATGIQAWIGYSNNNTHPNTWTNWLPASYTTDAVVSDEYAATLGASLPAGVYYFASRFQLEDSPYVYGGFSSGFWDDSTSISGTLTVLDPSGIQQNNVRELFGVFPNPASDNFSISIYSCGEPITVRLFNCLGQPVISDKAEAAYFMQKTYSVKGLAQGIYVVEVSTGNSISTKKLVINK
ncbi:MAG TPA: T9SS type A sorting domain-containing protein [Bacteroidales bacterium]|nr:T9SS type A sorting domain-containing protein [Bacteroidales bacterium]